MMVEYETNNSTGAEMEIQYRTEKRDDTNKIKIGIRFFYQ